VKNLSAKRHVQQEPYTKMRNSMHTGFRKANASDVERALWLAPLVLSACLLKVTPPSATYAMANLDVYVHAKKELYSMLLGKDCKIGENAWNPSESSVKACRDLVRRHQGEIIGQQARDR
jgi:hypothetical protein